MVNLRYAPRKKREDGWQQYSAKARLSPDDENPDYPDTMSNVGLADVASPQFDKAPRQSWVDGGKFGWRDGIGMALAGIGDAFTREGGGEGGMMNSMISRAYSAKDMAKKAQTKAAEDAAKYQDAFASFKAAGYPDAQASAMAKGYMSPSEAKPDMFNNKAGDRVAIGPNGQPTTLYRDENPAFVTAGNRTYAVNAHTGGNFSDNQPQLTPPAEAIRDLQSHPELKDQFDAMYGQGASSHFLTGGAGSQAPRGFRR